jgi:inorganic triphosphatase YgiF
MEIEIELKLSTQALAGPIIIEKLLPQLDVTVEQSEVELSNSYFDTLNRDFRKNDMGLRIRGCQHHYEQTLKAAGKGVAGLQQRPEYNISLGIHQQSAPEKPDLSLFPADVWPSRLNLPQVQKNLICQFSTQFIRSVFLLTWSDRTQVELVWDRGQVLASGRSEAINEIELELKYGSVNILFSLGQQIAELMPVTIGLLSKAARGYGLMDETKSEHSQKQPKHLTLICSENDIKQGDIMVLSAYLAKTLRQWQKMSMVLPNSQEAKIQRGHELKYYLSLLEKIMQQLNAKLQDPPLQHTILSLHEILLSLEELQYEVVDNITHAQQIVVEQGLFALVSDKKCIKVQLQIMQWLSKA